MDIPFPNVVSQSCRPDPAARDSGACPMAPKPPSAITAAVAARRARPGLPCARAVSDTATHVLVEIFQTSIKIWFMA
ncbi:hypothetical protein D3C72_1748280 [compost metagenome]